LLLKKGFLKVLIPFIGVELVKVNKTQHMNVAYFQVNIHLPNHFHEENFYQITCWYHTLFPVTTVWHFNQLNQPFPLVRHRISLQFLNSGKIAYSGALARKKSWQGNSTM